MQPKIFPSIKPIKFHDVIKIILHSFRGSIKLADRLAIALNIQMPKANVKCLMSVFRKQRKINYKHFKVNDKNAIINMRGKNI